MLAPYPISNEKLINKTIRSEIEWLKAVIIGVRTIRSEMNITPAKTLPLLINKASVIDKTRLNQHRQYLLNLAKLTSVTHLEPNAEIPPSATALVGTMELLIPLAGSIDIETERKRLSKEIEKLSTTLIRAKTKLKNPNFINKAPQTIVDKEQERVSAMQTSLTKLQEKLRQLK